MQLHYDNPDYAHLPHCIKFSGGRSSGYLLIKMLEHGLLDAERGDVVIFNNTSAEHPETYKFVYRMCKETSKQDIPFFILEFTTYAYPLSDRYGIPQFSRWFRLATNTPYERIRNPWGFRWQGEVFEHLISHSGFVPTPMMLSCTMRMKVMPTFTFLKKWAHDAPLLALPQYGRPKRDWGWQPKTEKRRGEWPPPWKACWNAYVKRGGKMPLKEYVTKKEFLFSQPTKLDAQHLSDYTTAKPPNTAYGTGYGKKTNKIMSLLGIRHDEPRRIQRIMREAKDCDLKQSALEIPAMPLVDWKVSERDIIEFWRDRPDDMKLPYAGHLSNCTFCFLKGKRGLEAVRNELKDVPAGLEATPVDIEWWIRMEKRYGRTDKKNAARQIGFFGTDGKASYRAIRDRGAAQLELFGGGIACNCTD